MALPKKITDLPIMVCRDILLVQAHVEVTLWDHDRLTFRSISEFCQWLREYVREWETP